MSLRSYSELIQIDSFEGRYQYLKLNGAVGDATFGHDRWINQMFYTSYEWRQMRDFIRARDEGCDLAWPDWPINAPAKIFVHHMNPMTARDIVKREDTNLDPEFLITVSHRTHNAIHYGDESQLPRAFVERRPGDTKLW